MTVIVFYLVVMTSNWTASYGPYPIEMCAVLLQQTIAELDKPPRGFLSKVICLPVPKLMEPPSRAMPPHAGPSAES